MIVSLCFLVAMLEGFDLQAVGVAALRMAPALHIAKSQMSWVFSVSMLGLVVGASSGGWTADPRGRKPVRLTAALTFGVFSASTYFAPDKGWLIVARLLTGVGLGGAMPNLIAMAAEISPPDRRTTTATLMFCGMPLGGAIVAALAGWLFDHFGWREGWARVIASAPMWAVAGDDRIEPLLGPQGTCPTARPAAPATSP